MIYTDEGYCKTSEKEDEQKVSPVDILYYTKENAQKYAESTITYFVNR